MVSRDERNEYHGVTVERANRILEAMQVQHDPGRPRAGTRRGVLALRRHPPQGRSPSLRVVADRRSRPPPIPFGKCLPPQTDLMLRERIGFITLRPPAKWGTKR